MNFIKITAYYIHEGKTCYYDVYINRQDILTIKDHNDFRYIEISRGRASETFRTEENVETIMSKIKGNYHDANEQTINNDEFNNELEDFLNLT